MTRSRTGASGAAAPKAMATPDVAMVVAAGGIGERYGDPRGKQFVDLCGRPLTAWSLLALDAAPSVGQIVVVCSPDRQEEMERQVIAPLGLVTPVVLANAGALRQDSCRSGLLAADTDAFPIVGFQDAARPLILPVDIELAISVLRDDPELDGCVVAHPSGDTLKECDGDLVLATPDRSRYWCAETPQLLRSEVALSSFLRARDEGFVGTDDVGLAEHYGARIRCVGTGHTNLKVTHPEDMLLARAILEARLAAEAAGDAMAEGDAEEESGAADGVVVGRKREEVAS